MESYPVGDILGKAQASIQAQDDYYQMLSFHIVNMPALALEGYLYDWHDLEYVNLEQPWWTSSYVENLSFNNNLYITSGDFSLTALGTTWCVYFNKNIAEEYSLPNLYDLVNRGDWTIDTMLSLCENVYTDTNGDGMMDEYDVIPILADCHGSALNYFWAFGERIFTKQPDGTLLNTYYSEKLVSIMEKLYSMYYESGYIYFKTAEYDRPDIFLRGDSLFHNQTINVSLSVMRDTEFDYGFLPYPKWNKEQTEYITISDGSQEGLAVPASIQDPVFTGIISEALNAESWKTTTPAFYDTALKYKGARDQESIKMLDMIVNSRTVDFGYIYAGGDGYGFWIEHLLMDGKKDIASHYATKHKVADAAYQKVFDSFEQ